MKFKILGILIVAGVAIQFIPYGKNHINPPIVAEPNWDSPQTKDFFYRACANCHSNMTTWPIYSKIAPISWLIQNDVNDGREHFISMSKRRCKRGLTFQNLRVVKCHLGFMSWDILKQNFQKMKNRHL